MKTLLAVAGIVVAAVAVFFGVKYWSFITGFASSYVYRTPANSSAQ